MTRQLGVVVIVLALTLAFSWRHAARAFQSGSGQLRAVITQPVDETRLVTLVGNTRPEANAHNDRGAVADGFPVDHMLLQLKRAPELEAQFEQYIDSLTDKSSPNFRHWMMSDEQGEKYGLAQQDLDTITHWLESHGFTVGYVYPNRQVIDFSGTAGQIRETFHTDIHALQVKGEEHFANMSNPKIPAALAPAVVGVVSMHNFKAPPQIVHRTQYTFAGCGGDCYALVPADFQTIYNLTPLYTAGIDGQGQTVVVVEDSDAFDNDWATYRTKFGLAKYGGTFTTEHPDKAGNCTDPGTNAADDEADLDVQMVTAIAPGAHVILASCKDGSTLATVGPLLAVENIVAAGSPPAVISMSYGLCEAYTGATANAAFNSAFQSAAAAGVSVFASSGDHASSFCAENFTPGDSYSLPGIGVTGWGESIYNVSVGGTDFEDEYIALEGGVPQSTYWGSANSSTFGSARSYIPEIPWNDSCGSYLIAQVLGFTQTYGSSGACNSATGEADFLSTVGGGGGPSNCATGAANPSYLYIEDTTCKGYAKPTWQQGIFGNPSDGVRDVPDVSLFASNGIWGHYIIICDSDTTNGGTSCAGAPSTWTGIGGTSASAPVMASIQALVNQKHKIRAGNPNPTYYSIAKSEFGTAGKSSCYSINQKPGVASTCVFYDVTQGDNNIPCVHNGSVFKADCYLPSGTYGALGTQSITSLALKKGGSGYTSTPTCTILQPANKSAYHSPTGTTLYAGGTTATCTATINTTTKVVTAVTLKTKGQGYTGVPTCTISGGGGTGATCMAVISPTAVDATAYQPAFGATPGWDMATGIGSVNATNLVNDTAW
jgi:Pro-kumamolisin, activation domain